MRKTKKRLDLDEQTPAPAYLEVMTDLLDTRFRIPGTSIRFGADFLIGLIPGAGDLISFGLSAGLVMAMVRHGASGMVIAKMLGNVALDATVGSVPLLGDLFDLHYKANRRNLILLQEHLKEGKHQGNAWPIVIGIGLILLAILVGIAWLIVKLFQWIF